MSLSENELSKEQKYLLTAFSRIDNEISELEAGLKAQYKSIINANKDFKEDVPILNGGADFDQVVEIYKFNDIVESEEQHYNNMNARLRVLRQMYDSAYFGKIEFKEDDEPNAEKYYIGISTLRDDDGDFLILDWRAPVCSLYYEYESGKCSYECPAGNIEGELLSKRQFGIFRDKINFAFDTDVLIEDELLCKVLSESRDKKMGNIVKSIQKEQNSAIRRSAAKNLVVFGPAGSGKTSVAMHRAAFLLYKYRETIKSKNILILSPNSIFKDYISDVLPDLGESEANIFSLTELFRPLLDNFNIYGHNELMEQIISGSDKAKKRIKRATFKNSMTFLEIMKRYAAFVDKNDFNPQTISHNGQIIISAEEIQKLYYQDWAGMSYSQRLKRISARTQARLNEIIAKRRKEIETENSDLFSWEIEELANKLINEEFAPVNSKIRNMFTVNTVSLYAHMYRSREFFEQIKDLVDFDFETFKDMLDPADYFNRNNLYWEDLFPLLFVKCIIDGQRIKFDESIRFVFVDEFQDIPPVGIYVIQKIFERASMTLVGDINQTIDCTAQLYDENILYSCLGKSTDIFKLTKSYRSTFEITRFANELISDSEIEYMDRHGDPVDTKNIDGFDDRIDDIINSIAEVKARGMNSVGVICKDADSANNVYNAMKNRVNASLVISDSDSYSSAVTVIPSYLAKGLEFDAVYVFDAERYDTKKELRLFYTVCTRAMHKLTVYGEHK